MGCMIMELMEAIQESEGRAERMVLTVLEGEAVSEKALVVDGEIVWKAGKTDTSADMKRT